MRPTHLKLPYQTTVMQARYLTWLSRAPKKERPFSLVHISTKPGLGEASGPVAGRQPYGVCAGQTPRRLVRQRPCRWQAAGDSRLLLLGGPHPQAGRSIARRLTAPMLAPAPGSASTPFRAPAAAPKSGTPCQKHPAHISALPGPYRLNIQDLLLQAQHFDSVNVRCSGRPSDPPMQHRPWLSQASHVRRQHRGEAQRNGLCVDLYVLGLDLPTLCAGQLLGSLDWWYDLVEGPKNVR